MNCITTATAVLVLFAALAASPAAVADTWRVELDGSGDFAIIQDAVDAAAPGDTILVGPGQFATIRQIPFWDEYDATVAVDKGGLVIEGAGVGVTVIGADYIGTNYRSIICYHVMSGEPSFTLRNATVIGGYNGLRYENDNLTVESCEFTRSTKGIVTFACRGARIKDCVFHDMEGGGLEIYNGWDGSTDFLIENCTFERVDTAVNIQATIGAVVRNCEFRENVGGIEFEIFSTGAIENCTIIGIPDTEYGFGVSLTDNCHVEMTDTTVDLSMSRTYSAVSIVLDSVLSGSGNVIRGGDDASLWVGGGASCENFRDNEIYRADDFCLVAQYWNENMYGPLIHLDMAGNYWGTDDPAQISAWIDDHIDHPQSPHYWMVVDYEPYLDEPVAVRKTTLGDVRGLFR